MATKKSTPVTAKVKDSSGRNLVFTGTVTNVKAVGETVFELTIVGEYGHKPEGAEEEICLTVGPINGFLARSYKGHQIEACHLPRTSQCIGYRIIEKE